MVTAWLWVETDSFKCVVTQVLFSESYLQMSALVVFPSCPPVIWMKIWHNKFDDYGNLINLMMRIILLVWTYHVNRAVDCDPRYPGHRCREERRYRGPSSSGEHLHVGGQPPVCSIIARIAIKSSHYKVNLNVQTLYFNINFLKYDHCRILLHDITPTCSSSLENPAHPWLCLPKFKSGSSVTELSCEK